MRIVHVVRQFHPAIGGMENVVWELANAQVSKGHTVRVVTLDRLFQSHRSDRLPARETVAGIEIVRIPFVGSRRYPIAWSVGRHIKDADIVHVHGLDFFFDYLAATWTLHRRRLVVSTHGAYFHTSFAQTLKRVYFSTVTRLSLSRYAGVVTVSEADRQLFKAIRSRGVALIENGVNIDKYGDAAAPMPTKTIVSLGRFSSNKRLDRLISFLAALRRRDPAWTLKIAGLPWEHTLDELSAMAEAAGVGHATEIIVSPSEDDIRGLMGQCSVFASASEYEGFGLAAVEGMSAGLFPVLNDIPPFRRCVERHRLGLTVDFSDPARAAERFLAEWESFAADYGAYRRRAIEASSHYRWPRVSEQYEAVYNSVLGTNVRSILDVAVEVRTFDEACRRLDDRLERNDPAMVVFASAHTLNQTVTNHDARTALRKSIVFNDGIGVDLASLLLFGKWFPENLNGTDFVPNYLKHTRHRLRVFLLGAKPGIAEHAAVRLLRDAPRHELAGCCHGYLDESDMQRIVEQIRRSKADLLLVAMGDPMQELWLKNHLAETGCRLGFAVGGLFDFMAGAVPRAPQWVRAVRAEWCWRTLQEPRRLWRRYFIGMPVFLLRVGRQWLAGPRVSSTVFE